MSDNNNTNFLGAVRTHVEQKDGKLRFKLTEEAIAALNKQQSFDNISVSGTTVTAREVDYAKVVEQLANPAESPATYDIVADEIHFNNFSGDEVQVPCTVAKVTNICTSQINQATVTKLYGGCQFQKGKQATELKSAIRAENSISGLDMFTKASAKVNTECVIKRTAMFDTGLSATVSHEDMKQLEYFKKLVVITMRAKQQMVAEYLSSIKGSTEPVMLAAYKNINRSMTDSIFNAAYSKVFGSVDPKNAAQAHDYYQAYQDYQDALLTAFPHAASAETIQFGINARKMTIAPNPIWTNMDKIKHVKQFTNGSYFVTIPIDLGILKIPTTREIVAKYAKHVETLTHASMLFIENEARLQAGYDPAADNIELPDVQPTAALNYYTLLGITEVQQQQLLDKMVATAASVADEVCNNRAARQTTDTLASIDNLFGNRS